jgi:hypothetical protein
MDSAGVTIDDLIEAAAEARAEIVREELFGESSDVGELNHKRVGR